MGIWRSKAGKYVVGIGKYNTLLLPCGRSRLLQRRGRVFAFRSCGPGSISTSGRWGFFCTLRQYSLCCPFSLSTNSEMCCPEMYGHCSNGIHKPHVILCSCFDPLSTVDAHARAYMCVWVCVVKYSNIFGLCSPISPEMPQYHNV